MLMLSATALNQSVLDTTYHVYTHTSTPTSTIRMGYTQHCVLCYSGLRCNYYEFTCETTLTHVKNMHHNHQLTLISHTN